VISSQCAIQDNVGTKRTDAVVFGSVGQRCPVAENAFMPCPFRFHNSKLDVPPVLIDIQLGFQTIYKNIGTKN